MNIMGLLGVGEASATIVSAIGSCRNWCHLRALDLDMGSYFTGIEVNQHNCDVSAKRLVEAVAKYKHPATIAADKSCQVGGLVIPPVEGRFTWRNYVALCVNRMR